MYIIKRMSNLEPPELKTAEAFASSSFDGAIRRRALAERRKG